MKTKWELFGGVDRSLMESLLRDEGEVIKQSPAKSVTRHEIGGDDCLGRDAAVAGDGGNKHVGA